MQKALVVILVGVTAALCWAQARTSRLSMAEAVTKLSSDDSGERMQAYEQLRSSPEAMRDAIVKRSLIELLDRENGGQHNSSQVSKDDESYAEYIGALLNTVSSIVDWKDSRQVCVLAHAPYNPDSAFAAELASAGETIVPCLMRMATSKVTAERYKAIPVLIQIKAARTSNQSTIKDITAVTKRALHDPDEIVRISTVDALGSFGTEDMIPTLKEVAGNDPSPEVQGQSIRKSAAEAIVVIQKRASQQRQSPQ